MPQPSQLISSLPFFGLPHSCFDSWLYFFRDDPRHPISLFLIQRDEGYHQPLIYFELTLLGVTSFCPFQNNRLLWGKKEIFFDLFLPNEDSFEFLFFFW